MSSSLHQGDGHEVSLRTDKNACSKTRRLSNRLKSQTSENAPVEPEAATKGGDKGRASVSAMDVEEDEDKRKSTCLKAANDALKKKSSEPAAAKQKRRRSSSSRSDENDSLPVPPPRRNTSASTSDEDNIVATEAAPPLPIPAASQTNKFKDARRRRSNSKDLNAEPPAGEDQDKENQAPEGNSENGHSQLTETEDRPREEYPGGCPFPTAAPGHFEPVGVQLEQEEAAAAAQPAARPSHHRIVRPQYMALRMKGSDPALCLDRIDDMYELYYQKEEQYSAKPYMHRQDDINRKMRAILVDWMVEVHFRFKLQTTTLWLSVNILDRYLMTSRVMRAKLQLVGITAILIACKYEEMQPPEVRDCVVITDEAYEKVELLEMEKRVLVALDYDIMVPTAYTFLARYLDAVNAAESTRYLACYYAERNLQEIDSLQHAPHHMAATAIYLANLQQQQSLRFFPGVTLDEWNPVLRIESGLEPNDIKPYARIMIKHVGEETETASKRRLTACKKKFALERYSAVSKLRLPTL